MAALNVLEAVKAPLLGVVLTRTPTPRHAGIRRSRSYPEPDPVPRQPALLPGPEQGPRPAGPEQGPLLPVLSKGHGRPSRGCGRPRQSLRR